MVADTSDTMFRSKGWSNTKAARDERRRRSTREEIERVKPIISGEAVPIATHRLEMKIFPASEVGRASLGFVS